MGVGGGGATGGKNPTQKMVISRSTGNCWVKIRPRVCFFVTLLSIKTLVKTKILTKTVHIIICNS